MGDNDDRLPPPPPLSQGCVPKTLADVAAESSGGSEPPGKKLKPTVIQKYAQMKRPGYGTAGTKVELLCNHFKVTFRPKEAVYQYNVTIDPPPRIGNMNRRVMDALHATYGQEFLRGKRFAYDGEKSLFVVGSLNLNRNDFAVSIDERDGRRRGGGEGGMGQSGRDFNVSIAHAATIDMKSIEAVLHGKRDEKVQDALRVLDIMLREHAAKKSYLLLKDSFFHPTIGEAMPVGEGVVLWRGFHVSFRPTTGGLSLNFDIANTLIIKPTGVIEFLQEQQRKQITSFDRDDWLKARRLLKGLMVETISQRKHKIIGLSPEACRNQMFAKRVRNGDGVSADAAEVQMSVADYFEKERNCKLRYPQLPALDGGRAGKAVYLPLEVCKLMEGQRYRSALSTPQRQKQIDLTRQPPGERQSLILKALRVNKYNDDDLVKEFNVNIDQNMKTVAGRVLSAPKLLFGRGMEETPKGGRWNYQNKSMKDPVQIPNWAVAGFLGGRNRMDFKKIAEDMRTTCGQKGMKLGNFQLEEEESSHVRLPPIERVRIMVEKLGKHLNKFMNSKPDHEKPFVLAILPEKSPNLYVPFKQMCEVKIGIVTQCIVPPKGSVNPKYLTSVSLKINLKRGGYNSVLSTEDQKSLPKISQRPTIIFGLDVCHGSPGDGHSSVAAAVATVDWPRISRFATSIRAQPAKVEMIQGLYESKDSGMVKEQLVNFYRTVNMKPEQILIFRDGVSESQFPEVLETELAAFKQACSTLERGYNPKITMVVVQKRHHTRFFPAKGGRDNVQPGTIVDRDPCDPTSNDFFMISHFGQIGTSRPTHYHVLYDEIGFTADEMQLVTNSLCYSYTRCTSAVSVVAPAYYAHLAAQHCRAFVEDTSDSGSESSATPMSTRIAKATATLPKLQDWVMKKMFYA